jgi:hypothetical protein
MMCPTSLTTNAIWGNSDCIICEPKYRHIEVPFIYIIIYYLYVYIVHNFNSLFGETSVNALSSGKMAANVELEWTLQEEL